MDKWKFVIHKSLLNVEWFDTVSGLCSGSQRYKSTNEDATVLWSKLLVHDFLHRNRSLTISLGTWPESRTKILVPRKYVVHLHDIAEDFRHRGWGLGSQGKASRSIEGSPKETELSRAALRVTFSEKSVKEHFTSLAEARNQLWRSIRWHDGDWYLSVAAGSRGSVNKIKLLFLRTKYHDNLDRT